LPLFDLALFVAPMVGWLVGLVIGLVVVAAGIMSVGSVVLSSEVLIISVGPSVWLGSNVTGMPAVGIIAVGSVVVASTVIVGAIVALLGLAVVDGLNVWAAIGELLGEEVTVGLLVEGELDGLNVGGCELDGLSVGGYVTAGQNATLGGV